MKRLAANALRPVFFIIVCFYFTSLYLYAQPANAAFRNLTPADGLPTTRLSDISQDSFGLIWIGSFDEVYRFDGITYKTIYSGDVRFLCPDNHGGMWISIAGGQVAYYNTYKDSLSYYDIPPRDRLKRMEINKFGDVLYDRFTHIQTNNYGDVWGATTEGVVKYDSLENKFILEKGQKKGAIIYPQSLGKHGLYFVLVQGKGLPYLIGHRDLKGQYNYEPFPVDLNNPKKGKLFFEESRINLLAWDSTGILLVNRFGWAYKKPVTSNWVFKKLSSGGNLPLFRTGIIDDNEKLWLNTINSITRIDIKSGRMLSYRHSKENINSILSSIPYSPPAHIFIDRQGILWIPCFSQGISRINLFESDFGLLKDEDGHPIPDILSALELNDGSFWIGAVSERKGLVHYNPDRSVIKQYAGNNSISSPPGKTVSTELSQPYAWTLATSSDGSLWVGTGSPGPNPGGLNRIRPGSDLITRFKYDPGKKSTVGFDWIYKILVDSSDKVWVSGEHGLCSIDPETEVITRGIKSIYSDTVDSTFYFLELLTSSGDLIIRDSLADNHYIVNHKTLEVKKFGPEIFTAAKWYYKHQDNAGRIWFVSSGKFGYLDSTFNKTEHIFDLELSEYHINEIPALNSDKLGKIWLATNNGIFQFDPVTEKYRHFSYERGLQGTHFFSTVNFRGHSGKIYFGGNGGINIFDPAEIKTNPFPPEMVFTGVNLDDKPVLFGPSSPIDRPIVVADKIIVGPGISSISISFTAIHFAGPAENHYAYKLVGFDKEWRNGGNIGKAIYTNLSPGEYKLFIKGSNWDGVWSDGRKSIKLIILPPFWATWWAYSIYVLFGMGILYSLRRYELNRTQLKNQVKLDEVKLKQREETDKMKSRFFANISHEFRTPLTLILGPAENLISKYKDEEIQKQTGAIKRNANRLLGLINQLLDLSRLEAGKLELKTSKSNIVSFIKGITMSFESVAERKDITLKIKSLNNNIELYFDKEKMTKIMTNLLSNAFKFTPEGGTIIVSVNEPIPNSPPLEKRGMGQLPLNESVSISVKDTGIGISKEELPKLFDRFYQVDSSSTREHEGTGIGLALTKELVELHHGTISVESKLGGCTEFTITLPVGRKHLKDEQIIDDGNTTDEVILNGIKSLNEFEKKSSTSSIISRLPQNEYEVNDDKNIILIVEDNADVREFIKDSLRNDFQIEEASNGEMGLMKAEQIIPDLIISDIMMPKMDGNELTKVLKNDERTSHIPIILLTAKSEQESKLAGLEKGADDYLIKPFDARELLIRINNLIEIRRKLQDKYSRVDSISLDRKGDNPVQQSKVKSIKLSNIEEQFINKVKQSIDNHLSEEEFSIAQLSREVGLDRVQLHRKLKALTGKSPSGYLRLVRLVRARKMLLEKRGNISEIAYSVGFSSPTYFTRCYKEEFGHLPSDLLN